MATAPEAPKINPGEPEFKNGSISFDGEHHPRMRDAHTRSNEVWSGIREKINSNADINAKYEEMVGSRRAANTRQSEAHLNAFIRQHLPEDYQALREATDQMTVMHQELHAEQLKVLKGRQTLDGATAEQFSAAVRDFEKEAKTATKERNHRINPTWYKNNYEVLHHEGVGAALKNSFSWETMRNHPGKTALKAGTATVGLGAMADATFRSKKTGANGEKVDRSWVARGAEFTGGAALTIASALHGGRSV